MGSASSNRSDGPEIRKFNAQSHYAENEAKRAETKAKRIDAEVLAINNRAYLDGLRLLLPWSLFSTLVIGFALDFYLHESPTYIKRRMLRTLRKCKPPSTLAPAPTSLLSVPQKPVILNFLPTLIQGPSGSGKSTLLSGIISSLRKPTPIVLIRMRMPSTSSGAASGVPLDDARILMNDIAKQVFSQIGFPLRRSLIGEVLARGNEIGWGRMQADLSSSETSDRLVTSLRMLFEVCEELKLERQKTMDPLDAAPVLLFDEVQDLIKDKRLKLAGGKIILDMLGSLLVGYCVDRKAVRAALTASSAELYFAFAENTPLRDARFNYFDLQDPDVKEVISTLVMRGYSTEEALAMVDLCGTRLRLLERPLTVGKEQLSSIDFIKNSRVMGDAAFAGVFSKLNRVDALQLFKILDLIECSESSSLDDVTVDHQHIGLPHVNRKENVLVNSSLQDGLSLIDRPTKEMLPESLFIANVSPILYVNRRRELFFQSKLHRHSWKHVRKMYSRRWAE